MEKQKKARVLVDCLVCGHSASCGDLISAPESEIKSLVSSGAVDDSKGAIKYAVDSGQELIAIDTTSVDQDEEPVKNQEEAATQDDGSGD